MNNNPFVSIIIPNYNHARYLDERLQSVLNQTYRNFEVIFLDDNSTDNSLDVIDRYKDNSHISKIVVNEENSGSTFKQWDKGIQLARGELIWIAESDDYCELNMLEELVKAFVRKKNVVVAHTPYFSIDENGEILNKKRSRGTHYYSGQSYIYRYMSLSNKMCNASAVLFSKKAAMHVTKEYTSFRGAGDYLFWTQILEQGDVAVVNKYLSYCRKHGENVTSKNFASGNAAKEDMYVLKYIDSKYHLSRFRMALPYYEHYRMFRDVNFYSEEIRQEVFNLWRIGEYRSKTFLWYYIIIQKILSIFFGKLV